MLSRRQLPLTWITLFILFCVISTVFARKHHDDDDDDDDDDDNDRNSKVKPDEPKSITPHDEKWLEDIDLDDIEGVVRPVGSGVCKDAKCDGSDNERCFESCGNMATEDDIYGCPSEKTWALSFDDGPSNFTVELLDILDKANVKATFCVMGAQALKYPEIVKRAYKAGHQIASHTYSHPHLMSLSNEEIVYEVRATEEAIKAAIGVKPRYIRPPYGEADKRVKSILKKMGYKTLMWNVDPTDYNVHMLKDGAQRIQGVFDEIASGKPSTLNAHNDKGFISLQHDLYQTSIRQIPKIIKTLRSKGFKMTTAAECIGDKKPHTAPGDHKEKHDDDDDDDDDYSEDAKKFIKEDTFIASGFGSKKEQQKQNAAQQQNQNSAQQKATSAANSITFSAAIGFTLAACGILTNYLI